MKEKMNSTSQLLFVNDCFYQEQIAPTVD